MTDDHRSGESVITASSTHSEKVRNVGQKYFFLLHSLENGILQNFLQLRRENGCSLLLDWTAYSFNHGFTNCSLSLSLALANLFFFIFHFQFFTLSSLTFTLALARMEFLFLKNLRCGKVWKSLIFGKQDFPTKESCTFSHN